MNPSIARFLVVAALIAVPYRALAVDAVLTDDTFVNSAQAGTNFGGNVALRVSATQRTFLRFDLSTLPAGIQANDVQKATLRLWVTTLTTAGPFDVYRVQPAAPPLWSEEGLTFNSAATQAILGAVEVSGVAVTSALSYVAIDVTALVKSWLATPGSNNGLALVRSVGSPLSVVLDSKEATGTSHEPRLEMSLNAAADVSARVYSTASVAVSNGVATPLPFDAERWDTHNIHNPANPTKLCAPFAGKYLLYGGVEWASNASGQRQLYIRLNGGQILGMVIQLSGGFVSLVQSVTTHYALNVGDCVELGVIQDSGTVLNVVPGTSFEFGMAKLP